MPKRHQQHPAKAITGHNNPSKTTEGTHYHSELDLTKKADSQERMQERERRSGSDSNANNPRKGSRVHDSNKEQKQPSHHEKYNDFSDDLEENNLAGEHHGMRDPNIVDYGRSAYDIKELYQPLADLTDDEMKSLVLVAEGSHLEQGAKYIDLDHLEQGEFTATANMIAEAGHHYVPKKEVDYTLWNRLNQVESAARLDEPDPQNP